MLWFLPHFPSLPCFYKYFLIIIYIRWCEDLIYKNSAYRLKCALEQNEKKDVYMYVGFGAKTSDFNPGYKFWNSKSVTSYPWWICIFIPGHCFSLSKNQTNKFISVNICVWIIWGRNVWFTDARKIHSFLFLRENAFLLCSLQLFVQSSWSIWWQWCESHS